MKGTIEECDTLVSILNAIIEKDGWPVDEFGFGYTNDGEIGTANGDDLNFALEWVWDRFFAIKKPQEE